MENESTNFIFGRHPVEEFLTAYPKRVSKVFIREGINKGDIPGIMQIASTNRIPVVTITKNKIATLVGDVNDQGILAEASLVSYLELKDWLKGVDISKNPAVFMLDEITDPHNVGAILRTAAAIGVAGVIIGKHNQSPVNGTVWKTSAGMAGRVPIVRVANINTAILELKDAGFWIFGLSMGGNSVWKEKFDSPSVFIMGSEGDGIRTQTLKHCDIKISIPMVDGVESLNASVSAAVVGYEWKRQNQ